MEDLGLLIFNFLVVDGVVFGRVGGGEKNL